jgi:tRNA dimethylallyltransferase
MGKIDDENTKPLLVVVTGPTASGKTGLAIDIAKKYNTEILSADSRQCYRELNIGVARPNPDELAAVPHHFIASHSITTPIDAAGYEIFGLGVLNQIFTKNEVAVVAGGTGLYIKALCEGIDAIPDIQETIREQVRKIFELEGLGGLQETLKQIDPVYFAEGEVKNPQRVMRALEVCLQTGKSIKFFQQNNKAQRSFQIVYFGIDFPKKDLHQRIGQRVDEMAKNGLVAEAKILYPQRHLNALQTVGYQEIFEYLDGNVSLEKSLELIKTHTRQYAKRQVTWFKKISGINWINLESKNEIFSLIDKIKSNI